MWFVLTRAPLPDAPYWPGRRLLALVDAVTWPVAWVIVATQLPKPAGIVAPIIVALAVLSALGRVHRAAWLNHRYHFTTWRWARVAVAALLFGLLLRLLLPM